MAILTQSTIAPSYRGAAAKTSILSSFIRWCNRQEAYRFGWGMAALAIQGCMLTPLTLFAVVLSGNAIIYWVLCMASMLMTLVPVLSAQPTRYSIPVFMLSATINVAVIILCLIAGFDISTVV
jgi:hypothetical protein